MAHCNYGFKPGVVEFPCLSMHYSVSSITIVPFMFHVDRQRPQSASLSKISKRKNGSDSLHPGHSGGRDGTVQYSIEQSSSGMSSLA